MQRLRRLSRQQRGDTIVEVMIVLAVLGLAIGICYATANRSLLNARQAQENSEATSLMQSQIEALRSLTPLGDSAPDTKKVFRIAPFCILNLGGNFTVVNDTDARCTQGSVGYKLSVTSCQGNGTQAVCQSGGLTADDNFVGRVTWDNVRGEGQDSVTLIYRDHKSVASPPAGGGGGGGGGPGPGVPPPPGPLPPGCVPGPRPGDPPLCTD